MTLRRTALAATGVTAAALAVLVPAGTAGAATAGSTFGGTITSTMTVNDGRTSGSIPAGTPYTGTLSYDGAQTPTAVGYNGGTHTVYTFTNLAFTIGSSTANSGPGTIDVYDNLTSTVGYPSGDSVYVNFTQGVPNTTGVAPSSPLAGLTFNWMGLALLDPSGAAVSGGTLPDLGSSAFTNRFSEFNFGTAGTAWGAGNTSMIQSLTSVAGTTGGTGGGGTTTTPPQVSTTSLPGGTVGVAYSAPVAASAPNGDAVSVAVSGLPAGLGFDGSTISGTPTAAGSSAVQVTATDSVTGLSSTVTLSLSVVDAPVVCSGSNAVETAYVARNPGFVVINGGLNLLDHLWTTNLNAGNTTFLGGLTNWFQTGLILSYTGTTDPNGCILDHLTVAPAVRIGTTALPSGTTGVAYQAPVSALWGVAPYTLTVSGLPAGLSFNGTSIVGTPTQAGTFSVAVGATDAVSASASATLSLTIAQGGNYTVKDESQGKITAVGPGYLMVGSKKLIWNAATTIVVNTASGELHVIDGTVHVGMKVQWKGLRDKATNTVLTSSLEVN